MLYDVAIALNDWCADEQGQIDAPRARALLGDLPTMRKLDFPDEKIACNAAVVESKWLNNVKGAADMRKQVKAAWIAAAEKSLATNRSTLAVLSMSELTSPDGMLAVLRAKGYQIEEPE